MDFKLHIEKKDGDVKLKVLTDREPIKEEQVKLHQEVLSALSLAVEGMLYQIAKEFKSPIEELYSSHIIATANAYMEGDSKKTMNFLVEILKDYMIFNDVKPKEVVDFLSDSFGSYPKDYQQVVDFKFGDDD